MLCVTSLFVILAISIVNAHICLVQPYQRGPRVDISVPANLDCYHTTGPCGNVNNSLPPGPVAAVLKAGSPYVVEFQQNLNHFYPNKPGFMVAEIATSDNGPYTQFGSLIPDFNAYDMVTQTNFSIKGIVPYFTCDRCVLRVRYVSNNPLEGANTNVFYECADIAIQ